MKDWHVVIGEKTFGPVTQEFVQEKINNGTILANTLIRPSDSPNWEAACKFFPNAKLPAPETSENTTKTNSIDLGILLILIPLVSTLLIWFWVSGMNLL
ncbi:MAG: DUF4339 domain-containing protein, partial [Deltaproteobacteria bacterium]|nr:DUF4339 domain-containing protein [Deltaproteobacteria bacterium]